MQSSHSTSPFIFVVLVAVHLCGLALFFLYLLTHSPDLDLSPRPQLTTSSGLAAVLLSASSSSASPRPPAISVAPPASTAYLTPLAFAFVLCLSFFVN